MGPTEAAQGSAAQRTGQGGFPGRGGPTGVSLSGASRKGLWSGVGGGEESSGWGTGEVSRAGPDSEGTGMLWKEFVHYMNPSGLSVPFDLGSTGAKCVLVMAAVRPSGVVGACPGPGEAQVLHPGPTHRVTGDCSACRRRLTAGLSRRGHSAGWRPGAPGPPWPSR